MERAKSVQDIVSYCRSKQEKLVRQGIEKEKEKREKERLEKERKQKEDFNSEKEKEHLENLTALFQISDRVNIIDVAEVLGLSRGEVVKKLIEWRKHFDVRLDGDYINIKPQDVNALMSLLDKSYQTWSTESTKAQKKE